MAEKLNINDLSKVSGGASITTDIIESLTDLSNRIDQAFSRKRTNDVIKHLSVSIKRACRSAEDGILAEVLGYLNEAINYLVMINVLFPEENNHVTQFVSSINNLKSQLS